MATTITATTPRTMATTITATTPITVMTTMVTTPRITATMTTAIMRITVTTVGKRSQKRASRKSTMCSPTRRTVCSS